MDIVKWARQKTVQRCLYDADVIDVEALNAIPGALIEISSKPNEHIRPMFVSVRVRPIRFVSHAPRGVR